MKSKAFPSSNSTRRILGCIAVVGAVALLAAGEPDSNELESRRHRIEKMSQVERDELQKKFKLFKDLPDERKESFRLIHQCLQDGESGRNLSNVLENYDAWLQTLSPWQREEIRAAPTPQARMEVVTRIKTSQEGYNDRPGQEDRPSNHRRPEEGPKQQYRGPKYQPLTPEDWARVMAVMEQALNLPAEERKELEQLPPVHRHVRVLLTTIRQTKDETPDGPRKMWPGDDVVHKMVEAVGAEQTRTQLQNDDRRRFWIRNMVLYRVLEESKEELKRNRPSEEEVTRWLNSLDESEMKKFMGRGGGFGDKKGGKDYLALSYLDQFKHDLFARDVIRLQKAMFFQRGYGQGSSQWRDRRGSYEGKFRDGNPRMRDRRSEDGKRPDKGPPDDGRGPGDGPRFKDGRRPDEGFRRNAGPPPDDGPRPEDRPRPDDQPEPR